MSLTPLASHTARAISRLTTQFRGKANIEALVSIFCDELDELETAFFQLLNNRALDVAVGVNLDNLGQIVGISRAGRTDEEFRAAIRVQIATNVANGTYNEFLQLAKIALNRDIDVEERFPAGLRVTAYGAAPDPLSLIGLRKLAPVTVYPIEVITWDEEPDLFAFSTLDGPQDDPTGEGFSSTDTPTAGGVMVSITEVV